MSGLHRMEEFKYIRGGATLVISLDGLNWFSKRRCSGKALKKWDEELQLWRSSGQMIHVEPQSLARFLILDQRGNATFHLWSNADGRSSSINQLPPPPHSRRRCCLLQEQQSTFTCLDSFVTDSPKTATRTTLNANMMDIFSLITKGLSMVTMNQHKSFIVFCDENIPQPFTDVCYTRGSRTFVGNSGCHNQNVSSDFKNVTDPNNNNKDDDSDPRSPDQSKSIIKDYFYLGNPRSLLKSCQNCQKPVSCGRDRKVKMRKSVSFDDDVMVYLFDQGSPTEELHSPPSTWPDVTLEDNGLEWEDDFSALEKNCHFQCVRHSQDYTFSLPTQSWMSLPRPERFSLPQTCLFLTHVAESDLEL